MVAVTLVYERSIAYSGTLRFQFLSSFVTLSYEVEMKIEMAKYTTLQHTAIPISTSVPPNYIHIPLQLHM